MSPERALEALIQVPGARKTEQADAIAVFRQVGNSQPALTAYDLPDIVRDQIVRIVFIVISYFFLREALSQVLGSA